MTRKADCDMGSSLAPTILIHEWVTGGGLAGEPCPESWAAEGRAMRRAIAADFAALPGSDSRIVVTLDTRWADDPGPWAIVPIVPGQLPERLLELAREADSTVLIAPETAGILAGLTRDLERAGARLLGSSPEAIELTGDKARLADWFGTHGIATPRTRTIVPADGLPGDWEYPAVLKPVDGAGSVDTYYLADRTELTRCRACHADGRAPAVRARNTDECQLPGRCPLGRAPHRHRAAEDRARGG